MQKKRSAGLTICTRIIAISSIAYGLLGFYLISRFIMATLKWGLRPNFGMNILYLILALLSILSGISLFRLRNWGRILFIAFLIFNVVCLAIRCYYIHLERIRGFYKNSYLGVSLTMVFLFLLIFFFSRPRVKEQFR